MDSTGSSIGYETVKQLSCVYHTPEFIRPEPVLSLIDFDECMLMPILSKSLANKVNRISVYASGYVLLDLGKDAFQIDRSAFDAGFDGLFSTDELNDPWIRIRPSNPSSSFCLRFSDDVPVRLFKSKQVTDASC